ncbi:hypothetical protein [Streptomyces flavofungini]|uniref:PBS lyase n=1 Tax=Streptomyces flavofungini TaxID=68200 RepID=A0ABS0X242_9ACTN|nr:hypothetical protein [Streptomyces flavofungini]MBJ3807258.1 hypothetical protein [Streptomyces flavofungini]GHC74130.1 hypothetical protein GCM10010349_52210 [Streptomyces flavofungini]
MTSPEPTTTAARLLAALDPLPHPQRMRELARWGRELRRDGLVRGVLEELEGGGDPHAPGGAGGPGDSRGPSGTNDPDALGSAGGPGAASDPGAPGGAGGPGSGRRTRGPGSPAAPRRWAFGSRDRGRSDPTTGGPHRHAAQLVPGRPYERGIAILLAAITVDTEWIAARLADPDPFVRGHALRAAGPARLPDAAFEAALDDAPEAVRGQLLRAVVAGRRTALADRLVDGVRRAWGDAAAARLLPGCSDEVAARLLPELFHAVRGWSGLARRHGELLLDVVTRHLAAPEALRDSRWEECAAALEATADLAPARVLDLLERYAPTRFPAPLLPHLRVFASADPAAVLRLLTGPWNPALRTSGHLTPAVLRALARSGDPEADAAVRRYARSVADDAGALGRLLAAHPPAARAALFTAARAGRGTSPVTESVVLDALPRRAAADEARRAAAEGRADGAYWVAVLAAESYLPCAEARDHLVAATRRPDAYDRADAWPYLIRNVARSGDTAEVTSLLADLATRIANEQDLVRCEALLALSSMRPALLIEAAAPHLDKLTADAVAARDCSVDSREGLSALAVAVLREHAASGQRELVGWSLRTLTRLSGSTGHVDLGRLDRTLRRGQEHDVYEALRSWIEAGAEKADYGLAFTLARAVGRRAHGMPALQELLWQAVRFGANRTAATAIDLWLDAPATRDERVALVLAREPSAAALPAVHAVLTGRRTDLLDQVLGAAPPYGRFLAQGSAWTVPAGPRQVRRWVPRQQQALLGQLGSAARDAGLPQGDRAVAVARCADVPGAGPALLRDWGADPEVRLAEAALGALARTDLPGDAVPALLAYADGDRARVAVYAASRASRYAPPSRLAPWLRHVLTGHGAKVTSRKEAVRLAAARLPAVGAAALLREVYEAPGAHRDVRAACVAFAAARLLGEEAAWHVLSDATRGDQVLRTALLRTRPLDVGPSHRERYARLVREVSDTEDTEDTENTETAVLAFDTLSRWAPWAPAAADVLAAACADLTRGRLVWQAAGRGLVAAAVATEGGGAALCAALDGLVEGAGRREGAGGMAGGAGEPEGAGGVRGAGPAGGGGGVEVAGQAGVGGVVVERDLPARRRVEFVVAHLAGLRGSTARAVCRRAGEVLAAHDGFVPQAARLLTAALDLAAAESDGTAAAVVRLAALHRDRPALTPATCRALATRVEATPPDAVLVPLARTLASAETPAAALFAVTLTAVQGTRTAWPHEWRTLLHALRRHPTPDVRDAALAVTFTPDA